MKLKEKHILLIAGLILLLAILISFLMSGRRASTLIPEPADVSGASDAVKSQIEEAAQKVRSRPSASNLGNLGMVYHSSANYEQAAQCYNLAIRKEKRNWTWNYYLGYLNMEMGDPAAAVEHFKRVTEINPGVEMAWYYLGEEYKNLRNNELAETAYSRVISEENISPSTKTTARTDHFPLSTYARFKLARLYFDAGRVDEADKLLKDIISKDNLFGAAYRLLGNISNIQGETEAGEKYTNRANDMVGFTSPVDTLADKLAEMSRSELYLLKKIDEAERSIHSDWALKLVSQGMKYLPENKYLQSKAIKIYLWKRMNDNAIAIAENHIRVCSDDFTELKNTGMLFYQKSLHQQAVNYWEKSLELNPGEPVISLYMAKSLYALGRKDQSLQLTGELAAQNQNNADVLADVTDLLFEFGQKDRANNLLSRIKKLAPSDPKVLRISGEEAQSRGEIKKAITLYEASLKKNPEDLKVIRNLGDLYMDQGMWDAYIRHYKSSLVHHPNNPEHLGRLGEALLNCPVPSLRNVDEGKEYSERAFTVFDCPPEILVSSGSHLAYAYALLGEKQKAMATITKTIGIGRSEKISPASQAKLENFYRTLQQIGE
jgi:tetratricopeptide (TPR) repeat protein